MKDYHINIFYSEEDKCYLQELINNAKKDFVALDNNKDIDDVIAEMRGNYENINAKIYQN